MSNSQNNEINRDDRIAFLNDGEIINGKLVFPDVVEDIDDMIYLKREKEDLLSSYQGGLYTGDRNNPYKIVARYPGNYIIPYSTHASIVTLHPDTEYICSYAFSYFEGELIFNTSLKGIGERSFWYCYSKRLEIPDGCLRIGNGAFENCKGTIVLPDSIVEIGKNAFAKVSYKQIDASPKVFALIGRHMLVEKALDYFKNDIRDESKELEWLSVISEVKTSFVKKSIDHRNANAMKFALIHDLTKKSDYEPLKEAASSLDDPELHALLQATNKKPSIKDLEKKEEREREKSKGVRPLTVADIKQLWDYRVDDDGLCTLRHYKGNESVPTIPAKIGKSAVSRIGEEALSGCTSIEKVIIPEGILAIGDRAFKGARNLKQLELPTSLMVVGNDLFSGCSLLEGQPELQKFNVKNVDHAGKTHYDYCHLDIINNHWKYELDPEAQCCAIMGYIGSDVNVIVPDTILGYPVKTIGCYSFSGGEYGPQVNIPSKKRIRINRGIKTITLPESIKTIGEGAFLGCISLESVNIPTDCKIEKYAFSGCKKMSSDGRLVIIGDTLYGCVIKPDRAGDYSISVPSNVRHIADGAFAYCYGLSEIVLHDGILDIGEEAFKECSRLRSIELPKGISEIRPATFCHCRALSSISIPENISIIGKQAFKNCFSLKRANIHRFVFKIGRDAFYACSELTIYCKKGSIAEKYAIKNNIKVVTE